MRKQVKVGDVLSLGLIPCRICKERHTETVVSVNPLQVSWAADGGEGHQYYEIVERKYIQVQRDEINHLLKVIRRLRSQLYKTGKEKS